MQFFVSKNEKNFYKMSTYLSLIIVDYLWFNNIFLSFVSLILKNSLNDIKYCAHQIYAMIFAAL